MNMMVPYFYICARLMLFVVISLHDFITIGSAEDCEQL
jgi:hypothetical protein